MNESEFTQRFEKFLDTQNIEKIEDSDYLSHLKTEKYKYHNIFSEIISHIGNDLNILDIGATPFTSFLKLNLPNATISTIDLTDTWMEYCKKREIIFKKCDITKDKLPFENDSFDIIIFADVLEHLYCDPSIYFNKIHNVLKKQGILIITTPNFTSLYKRINFVVGISPLDPFEEVIFTHGMGGGFGHIREHTMRECIQIITSNKFLIKKHQFARYHERTDVQSKLLKTRGNAERFIIPKALSIFAPIYNLLCLIIPQFRADQFIVCNPDK